MPHKKFRKISELSIANLKEMVGIACLSDDEVPEENKEEVKKKVFELLDQLKPCECEPEPA